MCLCLCIIKQKAGTRGRTEGGSGEGGGGGEGSRRGSSVKYHLSRSLLVNNVILNLFFFRGEGRSKQTAAAFRPPRRGRLARAEASTAANNGAASLRLCAPSGGASGMRRDSGASSQAKQACAVLRDGKAWGGGGWWEAEEGRQRRGEEGRGSRPGHRSLFALRRRRGHQTWLLNQRLASAKKLPIKVSAGAPALPRCFHRSIWVGALSTLFYVASPPSFQAPTA